MKEIPDFATFCSDRQLLNEPISSAWPGFYKAVEALPLDPDGVEIFRLATGRDRYQARVYTEATALCGRRSEKTSTALKYLIWKSQYAGWEQQLRTAWFARLA